MWSPALPRVPVGADAHIRPLLKAAEETPGQTEAVPEAGQPLIIGHFALQIVETVEKIQPEGGADLVVAGADALQPLLIAGGLTEIQVPVTQLMF